MQRLVESKLDEQNLQKVAQDLKGYIKVVVDVEREILAAGGLRYAEAKNYSSRMEPPRKTMGWGPRS